MKTLENYLFLEKKNINKFIILNFVVLFIYSCLISFLVQFYFGKEVNDISYISDVNSLLENHTFLYLFILLPISAMFEEVLYRLPFIYYWASFKAKKNKILIIIFLQLIFAILHLGNFNITIYTLISLFLIQFVSGIILTAIITNVYLKTKNFWKSYFVTVIFHYLHNLLNFGILTIILFFL